MHTRHALSIIQGNKASELYIPNNFVHAKNYAAEKLLIQKDFEMGSKFPNTQNFRSIRPE